jgi:prefoldin subunit 5
MLNEEKIIELNESLEKAKSTQDELNAKHEGIRKSISELKEKINFNLKSNESMELEIASLQQDLVTIASEYNPLNSTIDEIQNMLTKDAWDKSVEELVSKQLDFFTIVERELERIQSELLESVSGFVEFVDPATACKAIRKTIEVVAFSQSDLMLRSGLQNYNRAIRDLCERKLRGQPIDLEQGALPVDRVKDWLRTPDVIRFWKKG